MSLKDKLKGVFITEDTSKENLGGVDYDHYLDMESGRKASTSYGYTDSEDESPVEVPEDTPEDTATFVNSVYEANNMQNRDRSIYMVDVYMKTLPSEMLAIKKAETVINILSASKLTKEEVLSDGINRIEMLHKVNEEIVTEETAKIDDAAAEIERLKNLINQQEKIINDSNKKMEVIHRYVNEESGFIELLVKSIDLNNGGK